MLLRLLVQPVQMLLLQRVLLLRMLRQLRMLRELLRVMRMLLHVLLLHDGLYCHHRHVGHGAVTVASRPGRQGRQHQGLARRHALGLQLEAVPRLQGLPCHVGTLPLRRGRSGRAGRVARPARLGLGDLDLCPGPLLGHDCRDGLEGRLGGAPSGGRRRLDVAAGHGALAVQALPVAELDELVDILADHQVDGLSVVEDDEAEAAVVVRGAGAHPAVGAVRLQPGLLHAPELAENLVEVVLAHVLGHAAHEDLASLRTRCARAASAATSAAAAAALGAPAARGGRLGLRALGDGLDLGGAPRSGARAWYWRTAW
mmetsp:Transcript_5639/g.15201  ORF Transcript_5639/g.15201 Transcript_5639/m.15201 type:complete len:314 (-) Transcript_5639:617-1558(-)